LAGAGAGAGAGLGLGGAADAGVDAITVAARPMPGARVPLIAARRAAKADEASPDAAACFGSGGGFAGAASAAPCWNIERRPMSILPGMELRLWFLRDLNISIREISVEFEKWRCLNGPGQVNVNGFIKKSIGAYLVSKLTFRRRPIVNDGCFCNRFCRTS
jgi:hypothetical protein